MKIGKNVTIFSWSLYDFANTIFAMNITSWSFPLWVTLDKGGQDLAYSVAFALSMLLVSISLPIMGVISDRYKRRLPFLILFTLLCVGLTGLMGLVERLLIGLVLFGMANFCYQAAGSVFYNALLPEISSPDRIGRISGYGVSLGYVGTIVGLILVRPFVLRNGHQAAFIPSAFLFLLFSLPCFIFVRDRAPKSLRGSFGPGVIKEAFQKLKKTLGELGRYPGLVTYLASIFIAVNAINTIIIFMAVYSRRVIGFTDREIPIFFIVSAIFAILGSFIFGFVCDRFGPKRTLSWVLGMWCFTIALAASSFSKPIFWVVGPLAGWALGSTWVAARPLLVQLAPTEKVGEFFGFAGLAGKSAAIVGPLIWGLIVWGFRSLGVLRYRLAALALLVLIFASLLLLQRVPEAKKR